MDLASFTKTEKFKKIVYVVAGVVILLVVFQAGEFVGFHKAAFSYGMGDNYYRAFGREPLPRGLNDDFPNAHGATGKIVSVTLPTFVIEDQNHVEKVVRITNATLIRHLRDTATTTDLVPGGFAVVIGTPNSQAEIQAAFIRLLPPPPEMGTTTATH